MSEPKIAKILIKGSGKHCGNCKAVVHSQDTKCWKCETELVGIEHSNEKIDTPEDSMNPISESKYPALRTISGFYQFLAIIVGLGSALGLGYGIGLFNEYGKAAGTAIIIYALIMGLIGVITLLAISEGIKLFIQIEDNTNKQNSLLTKLIDKIKVSK